MRGVAVMAGLAMLLTGCAPSGPSAAERQAEVDRLVKEALAKVEAYEALAAPASVSVANKPSPVAAKQTDGAPMDNDDEASWARAERNARAKEAAATCWQDYCPCQEDGPTDKLICRNLKGGIPVDDNLMSVGAAQRDMRQGMDDYNRKHPDAPIEY